MKKNFLTLSCIAAVAITTFVGKKTFGSQTSERNNLLAQNVEALSQGEVTNGYVMKINPMYKKTCYSSYVDATKYRTIRMYEESVGYYEYKEYYHSYNTYTRARCEVMDIIKAPGWWQDCSAPTEARCNAGDVDKRPEPYEFWQ
ncbi:MAG: hypothetical protein K2J00_08610 [Bacteroidaceae bacterium]|nr:hypothetical protein [Bacteroidaceae bacterium]